MKKREEGGEEGFVVRRKKGERRSSRSSHGQVFGITFFCSGFAVCISIVSLVLQWSHCFFPTTTAATHKLYSLMEALLLIYSWWFFFFCSLVVQEDCGWSQHQQQKKKSSSSVLESGASSSFFSGCWVSSTICVLEEPVVTPCVFFSQSVWFQNWVSELNPFHICLTHVTTSSCWVVDWKNKSNGISLVFFFFLRLHGWFLYLLYLRLAFQKHSVSAWEENPKVHHHLTKCGADNKQTFTCCFTKFYH